jgi:hypothetical protein
VKGSRRLWGCEGRGRSLAPGGCRRAWCSLWGEQRQKKQRHASARRDRRQHFPRKRVRMRDKISASTKSNARHAVAQRVGGPGDRGRAVGPGREDGRRGDQIISVQRRRGICRRLLRIGSRKKEAREERVWGGGKRESVMRKVFSRSPKTLQPSNVSPLGHRLENLQNETQTVTTTHKRRRQQKKSVKNVVAKNSLATFHVGARRDRLLHRKPSHRGRQSRRPRRNIRRQHLHQRPPPPAGRPGPAAPCGGPAG